jgi:hypothetical protein
LALLLQVILLLRDLRLQYLRCGCYHICDQCLNRCFVAGLLLLHVAVLAVVGCDLYLPCLLELVVNTLLLYELILLNC